MAKKLQLNINQPCHEDWNQMTDTEKGKFCGSCQKQVIDFTGMNDEQLIAFFRKPSTGSVCGRFMGDQLQRDITLPKKRIPWFKYFFQFALPAFVLSLKAKAQISSSSIIGDTVITYSSHPVPPPKEIPDLFISSKYIHGKVIDNNNNPVPFASIQVGENGIAADSAGHFSFDKKWMNGISMIEVSSVGFDMKLIAVNTILDNKEMIVQMTEAKSLGEVVLVSYSGHCTKGVMGNAIVGMAGGISVIKEDAWTVKNLMPRLFNKDSVKVYPNPVRSGNPVTIEVLKAGKERTTIELFSVSGQLVYSTQINMNTKAWKAAVPLPKLTAGTYVMRVSRGEKEKPYSTKILIQ